MAAGANRLMLTLGLYGTWVATTMIGGVWITGSHRPLTELVSNGVGPSFVAAVALLLAALVLLRWNDVGLNALPAPRSLRLLWLPAVYLGAFAMGIATLGLPPTSVVIFVSINTMLVGFSEELMFRGILLQGLLSRLSIWPAIWVTSALFGAVHVLNVFITGELLASMIQAVAAFMSGMMFMAIRIRSGSLWPAIVYHALWDFCLVLLSQSPQVTHLQEPALSGPAMLLPMLLVLPHFLYGLFLLRKVGSTEAGG